MAVHALRREAPASYEDAASLLHECAGEGLGVRVRGGATKYGWGRPAHPDVELSTAALELLKSEA